MSDDNGTKTTTAAATGPTPTTPAAPGTPLPDLMAAGAKAASKAAGPPPPTRDLDVEALRAAEHALAAGEQALAAARANLREGEKPQVRNSRRRELALRGLLVVNVLAMFVVAMLPVSQPGSKPTVAPADDHAPSAAPSPMPAPAARFNEPWNRALAAAEQHDFAQAVGILEQYLADSPRMAPSQRLNVLMTLAHYAACNNDTKAAREYQRRADAIENSHSLPEDLVMMAKAAAESGDQEGLRRVWARFLLQQRQIPSWLYKHVAEAYLQLGDSYRQQANAAAEQARLQELEETTTRLRGQDKGNEERGK